MADCNRWLSSRMIRLARAAVAATQIIATGMKIAIIVTMAVMPLKPASAPFGIRTKKTTDVITQSALRAIAMISMFDTPCFSGRSYIPNREG